MAAVGAIGGMVPPPAPTSGPTPSNVVPAALAAMAAAAGVGPSGCIGSTGKPLTSWACYVKTYAAQIKAAYPALVHAPGGGFVQAAKLFALNPPAGIPPFRFKTPAEQAAARAASFAKLKARGKVPKTAAQKAASKAKREAKLLLGRACGGSCSCKHKKSKPHKAPKCSDTSKKCGKVCINKAMTCHPSKHGKKKSTKKKASSSKKLKVRSAASYKKAAKKAAATRKRNNKTLKRKTPRKSGSIATSKLVAALKAALKRK